MSKPENPMAFPKTLDSDEVQFASPQPGMTLRDYFASHAMLALINIDGPTELEDPAPYLARASYHMADAMLAERAKGGAQ